MVYIIPIVSIIVCALLFWLGSKLFDRDCVFRSVIVTIFAVIFAIAVLVSSINAALYVDYKANEEARMEWRIEERNVLTTMLGDIGSLMESDVTASNTYMSIYNEVIAFNRNVREANTWTGTMWEGILCDPSYAELDIIPLN
jgi:hypothetical protein